MAKKDIVEFFRSQSEDITNKGELLIKTTEIINLFHKVLKGYKLYPPNNPVFRTFAEEFKTKVDLLLTEIPAIPIRIGKTYFKFMNEVIETNDDDTTVPYTLFNDGIREIFIQKGITFDEIMDFFSILAQVTLYANEDYDIATLIWDKDFAHIGYITEEELSESETFLENDFEQEFDFNAQSNRGAYVNPEETDEFTLPAIDKELQTLSPEEKEKFLKLLQTFDENHITSLFLKEIADELLNGTNEFARKELTETASRLWERLILFGAYKEGVVFLKTLLQIGGRMRVTQPEIYTKIRKGVSTLYDIDFIDEAFKGAESVSDDQIEFFAEFVAMTASGNIGAVIPRITDLSSRDMRIKSLHKIAENVKNYEQLRPLVNVDNWRTVRNTLTVLRFSKDPRAIPVIRHAVNHPQEQIRIEAIAALMQHSIDEALPVLEKSVFSPEKKIRLLSVEKLLESDSSQTKAIINRVFKNTYLEKLDKDEINQYMGMIIKKARTDLYDLIAVLLFNDNKNLQQTALQHLAEIDDVTPIVRQIQKFIQSDRLEKLSTDELKLFVTLIRREHLEEILPSINRILTLSGGMFNKKEFLPLKRLILYHIAQFKDLPHVQVWFKEALNKGNKETESVLREIGGIY